MKNLIQPLENGLIPIIEVAKILYPNEDFSNPQFHNNTLIVHITKDCTLDHNIKHIQKYLCFDNIEQIFKLLLIEWDDFKNTKYSTKPVDYNQNKLFNKLYELEVIDIFEYVKLSLNYIVDTDYFIVYDCINNINEFKKSIIDNCGDYISNVEIIPYYSNNKLESYNVHFTPKTPPKYVQLEFNLNDI